MLPPQEVTYPDCLDAYKWFARFLLEGLVFNSFKIFTKSLTAAPSLITSTWNIAKVNQLVECLAAQQVASRRALTQIWKKNRDFLLAEIKLWLPASAHQKLEENWPLTEKQAAPTKNAAPLPPVLYPEYAEHNDDADYSDE